MRSKVVRIFAMAIRDVKQLCQQRNRRRNEKCAREQRVGLRRGWARPLILNDESAAEQQGDCEEKQRSGKDADGAFALRHRLIVGHANAWDYERLEHGSSSLNAACAAGGSSTRRKSRYENDGAAYLFLMTFPHAQRGFCPCISPLVSTTTWHPQAGFTQSQRSFALITMAPPQCADCFTCSRVLRPILLEHVNGQVKYLNIDLDASITFEVDAAAPAPRSWRVLHRPSTPVVAAK